MRTLVAICVCLAGLNACFLAMALAEPAPNHFAEFPPTKGPQTLLVTRVIDGDTFEGAFMVLRTFRLHGCNAKELHAPGGPEARGALEAMIPPASLVDVELQGLEKFGRTLAKVKDKDGNDVTTSLIGAGHAKPWDGKGPRP